jgi:hypothetical protein
MDFSFRGLTNLNLYRISDTGIIGLHGSVRDEYGAFPFCLWPPELMAAHRVAQDTIRRVVGQEI